MALAVALAGAPPRDRFDSMRATPPQPGALRVLVERVTLGIVGTCHRLVYRTSGGRLGRTVRGGPVLLLTTVGRRSGRSRTWPLCYVADGEALVLVASAGGAPRHPGWYLNLRYRRRVIVRRGDQARPMLARTAEGQERAQLWERIVQQYPICADYQRRTTREFPIVVLDLDSPVTGGSKLEENQRREVGQGV